MSRYAYVKDLADYSNVLKQADAACKEEEQLFYRTEELERKTKNDDSLYGYASGTIFSSLMKNCPDITAETASDSLPAMLKLMAKLFRSTPLRDNACWYAPENMRLLFSETLSSHAHSVLLVQKRRIPRLTDEDLRHTEILSRALAATQVTMVEHIIADSSSRIAHYLINLHIEQSQLAEVSSLLAHWMDAE